MLMLLLCLHQNEQGCLSNFTGAKKAVQTHKIFRT